MDLSLLTAISPIDGRYRGKTEPLADYFSEYALIRYRVRVEIEYFIALCELPLPQLMDFNHSLFDDLRNIYREFTPADAQRVKDIEAVTNHDVKAVEYFIKEKLDSMGLDNIEVILVDDCSTDKSGEIIDDYSNKYESIIGIHLLENSQSPSKPRNVGIRNASSNYIIFQDSDDGFTLDACEWLYGVMVEEDVDLVTGMISRNDNPKNDYELAFSPWNLVLSQYENYREKDIKKLLESDELLKLKLNSIDDNPVVLRDYALNSIIFKKSFLIKNNIQFPEYLNCGEDSVFLFDSYIKAEGIVFINKVIYNYNTQRMDSLTHDFSLKTIQKRPKAYRLMYDRAILNNKKDMYIENILFGKINYWFNKHVFKAPELDDDLLLSIFKSQQILFAECINYNFNVSDIVKSICQDIKDNNFVEAVKKINNYRSNISVS